MVLNNYFTLIFLAFLFFSMVFKIYLDIVNYYHRKKNKNAIPSELKGFIDKKKLININKYTNEKLIFSLFEYFIDKAFLLIILFCGLIPIFYNFLLIKSSNNYINILLFFGAFYVIQIIIDIPFSLYYNFKLEKKYEFNKMTFKIWIFDFIKQIIISIVIFGILLAVLVFFISTFKYIWWLLLWGFIFLFSLVMQVIYPTVIAPLFNKFIPLEKKELKNKIEKLLKNSGLKSSGIFQMDASKRSSHSNAYFTGIGKSKKIVLFDSLLQKHTNNEILSILAHEIGHYKHKHVLKGMILSTIITFSGLLISYLLINNSYLYNAFGFDPNLSIEKTKYIGLFLIMIISGPITFFLSPLQSMISRKQEFQADYYAYKAIKTSKYLVDSLIKLSIDNLSNIYPAEIYSWFYYSHPPLFKRIRTLKSYEKK